MTDTEAEVITFLSKGASYGLPGTKVACIETHCSIVFLVGNRAYKLKRPIAFSLLDYRTVRQREAACRAELALNRRTAPELYLAVQAIRRRPNGEIAFDGEGQILDWIVVMRRFDQADLFDRLAETSSLTPELMRCLADEIARFHSFAEPTSEFGGKAGLRAIIERNRTEHRTVGTILAPDAVESLYEESIDLLGGMGSHLDQRRDGGRVRRCHGDLRLANICLIDGRPTLFDAIEFCDEASCIDVLFDLAFLLVELHQRGLDSLGNVVFNRYLDTTGDVEGLVSLPLMLSIRAASRAYTLALAAQRRLKQEERQHIAATARSYLALASSLLMKSKGRLIALGGLSSHAKSLVADDLAAFLPPVPGARVLRSNLARKRLLGLTPADRLPATAYTPEVTGRVYAALCEQANQVLRAGFSAIVDASFRCAAHRKAIEAEALRASVPFVGISLGVDQDVNPDITADATAWHILQPEATPAATAEKARLIVNTAFRVDETALTGI